MFLIVQRRVALRVCKSLFILLLLGVGRGGADDVTDIGWVHGRCLDSHGSVIPGIHVTFASRTHRREMISDAEGRVNCAVPPGQYSVIANAPNILPYQRAPIQIERGVHKYVIVRPIFVAPTDQSAVQNAAVHYQSFTFPGSGAGMIRFDTVSERGRSRTFRGEHLMLSFDQLSVFAREFDCSADFETCQGTGEVEVFLGRKELFGTGVRLALSNRTLVLTRDATVSFGY